MTHDGYTYHEGLNENLEPLNEKPDFEELDFDPEPDFAPELFFSDEENILKYCNSGNKIATVTVPKGEDIVTMTNKYKAHRIILGEIRDLWTVETFQWLKQCGVNLHVRKDSPLLFAAAKGHLEIVKYLIKHGVNGHQEYDTALRLAVTNGHLNVIKYLAKKGANLHSHNDEVFGFAVKQHPRGDSEGHVCVLDGSGCSPHKRG